MTTIRIILALTFLWPLNVVAQQQAPTAAQRLQGMIGNCIGENVELATRLDQANQQVMMLNKTVADLEAKLKETEKK